MDGGGGSPRLPSIAHFAFLAFTHIHPSGRSHSTHSDTQHHAQTYIQIQIHTQICQNAAYLSSSVTMNQFVEVESCPFFGLFPLEGSSLTFRSVSDGFDGNYDTKCQGIWFVPIVFVICLKNLPSFRW